MSEARIYLNCPFDDKEECKELGGRWDGDEKKWYITPEMDSEPFSKWAEVSDQAETELLSQTAKEKTYLNCTFDDKEECKSLGGKWDGDAKKWFVPEGVALEPFSKWL